MQFDRQKFKTLLLYASRKCHPSEIGAVKLHKILYFSDMIHFANTGDSITGASYSKRPHGPTCDQLLIVLRDMERAGEMKIDEVDYFGFRKKQYVPLANAETDRFNDDELKMIDEVIDFVCRQNSAKTISELSHTRAWEMADFGETLEYNSAFYIFPNESPPEVFEWLEGQADVIEAERSHVRPVELEDYRSFRGRLLAG